MLIAVSRASVRDFNYWKQAHTIRGARLSVTLHPSSARSQSHGFTVLAAKYHVVNNQTSWRPQWRVWLPCFQFPGTCTCRSTCWSARSAVHFLYASANGVHHVYLIVFPWCMSSLEGFRDPWEMTRGRPESVLAHGISHSTKLVVVLARTWIRQRTRTVVVAADRTTADA